MVCAGTDFRTVTPAALAAGVWSFGDFHGGGISAEHLKIAEDEDFLQFDFERFEEGCLGGGDGEFHPRLERAADLAGLLRFFHGLGNAAADLKELIHRSNSVGIGPTGIGFWKILQVDGCAGLEVTPGGF